MQSFNLWLKRFLFISLLMAIVSYTLYITLNNVDVINLDLFFYDIAQVRVSVIVLGAFVLGSVVGLCIDFASRLRLKNTISVLEKKLAKLEI